MAIATHLPLLATMRAPLFFRGVPYRREGYEKMTPK
jgi:hypothetical protein